MKEVEINGLSVDYDSIDVVIDSKEKRYLYMTKRGLKLLLKLMDKEL